MKNLTAKRSWFFSDLDPGKLARLGHRPNDEWPINCELRARKGQNGIRFWVLNGAWGGTLYEGEEGCLHIIDDRGTRHEPVYIVDVEEPKVREPLGPLCEDEVPF